MLKYKGTIKGQSQLNSSKLPALKYIQINYFDINQMRDQYSNEHQMSERRNKQLICALNNACNTLFDDRFLSLAAELLVTLLRANTLMLYFVYFGCAVLTKLQGPSMSAGLLTMM